MTSRQRIGAWVVLALAITGGLWFTLDGVADRVAAAERSAAANAESAQQNSAALEEANERVDVLGQQVRSLGEDPVVPTSPLVAVPGPRGERGLRGLMGEEGPTGPVGPAGQAGADGSVGAQGDTGPAGPQGAPGPQGPAGERGAAGSDGEPGRGIASLECEPDGRWTVTYTDGTDEDAGACRVLAAPEDG